MSCNDNSGNVVFSYDFPIIYYNGIIDLEFIDKISNTTVSVDNIDDYFWAIIDLEVADS